MITDLNKILVEWAYRTSDGKPDVKNSAKLLVLESVLNDFGWSEEARAELLSTLMEGDEWWSKMTPAQQAAYIKKHPKSQKAQDAKQAQVAQARGGRGGIAARAQARAAAGKA